MSQAEFEEDRPKRNPMPWIILIVVALVAFIMLGTDRGGRQTETVELESADPVVKQEVDGQIDRQVLAPPGERARELITVYRKQGKPYPFDKVMASASSFANEGNLADAHLLFFFAAREGHIEAMMMMAEMSDPTLFQAENNLMDRADAVQAYKWYQAALDKGFQPAQSRLDNLHRWAKAEAQYDDPMARQLLLNFN